MFGLVNFHGSCWVNAALQTIFRFPDVQARYNAGTFEKENPIDEGLCRLWNSQGKDGLRQFFDAVRTATMPAGLGIGDSHELITYLCDKLPYLDKLCRFSLGTSIECNSCKDKTLKHESVINFSLMEGGGKPIAECIENSVKPVVIQEWKCEKCKGKGATLQQLIGSFPTYMIFHLTIDSNIDYSSILILNKRKYALIGVVCFNGGHWWMYGRDGIGKPWYILDDMRLVNHGPKQFPISNTTRMLIYYCA
jgi:uncharacterized UBP type Zn finger protein